jgi:hypothetical protein
VRALKASRADMVVSCAPWGALFSEAAAREVLGAAESDVSRECSGGFVRPVCRAARRLRGFRPPSACVPMYRAVVLHRRADGPHSCAVVLHRRAVDRQVPTLGAAVESRIRVSAGPLNAPVEAIVGFCCVGSPVREQFFGARDAERSGWRAPGLAEGHAVGADRAVPRHIERR